MSLSPKAAKAMPATQDSCVEIHPSEARWFAVYTRFKSEKVVQRLLTAKGIENYLPLLKVTRRYARKIKHHDIPLITCYIFVKIMKKDFVRVMETENVVRFVRFKRAVVAIPEEEIELMRRIVGELDDVTAEPGLFAEGDQVEVVGGNLTGLRGRLVEKQGKKQMVVDLETIGFSLRITIDASLLRKI